jgi:hypothetical protein
MSEKKARRVHAKVIVFVAVIIAASFELFVVFPPSILLTPSYKKPIILYYNGDGHPPLQVSQFPGVVNFTLRHGFNVLMLLVFNYQPVFNRTTVNYFALYAKSRGLTFVPSYYVRSVGDEINVSGLAWINLDMERLNPSEQVVFYDQVAGVVPLVSVTTVYGQLVQFHTPMNIIETYAGTPLFWLAQLGYYHPGKLCSVGVWLLHNQQDYDDEKNYCLKYSDGVMVFDYYGLLRSGFN